MTGPRETIFFKGWRLACVRVLSFQRECGEHVKTWVQKGAKRRGKEKEGNWSQSYCRTSKNAANGFTPEASTVTWEPIKDNNFSHNTRRNAVSSDLTILSCLNSFIIILNYLSDKRGNLSSPWPVTVFPKLTMIQQRIRQSMYINKRIWRKLLHNKWQ